MPGKLILGTVQFGMAYGINNRNGQPVQQEVQTILDLAQKSGITTLDTARAYGNAMELIGSYHRSSDFKFDVISKFHKGTAELAEEIQKDLKTLELERFEAYLFHSFSDFETASAETFEILSRFRQQGFIRKIGVSVYGNDQFEKAIENSLVDLIQLPYNLLDNASQRGGLLLRAKERKKELHIRSAFLQGLFFMDPAGLPEKLVPLAPHLQHIRQLAMQSRMSMQDLALAYALRSRHIDKVLIGVDSAEQLKMNLQAAETSAAVPETILREIDSISVQETHLLSPANWK